MAKTRWCEKVLVVHGQKDVLSSCFRHRQAEIPERHRERMGPLFEGPFWHHFNQRRYYDRIGGGGYAMAKKNGGNVSTSMYLEFITWDEYIGEECDPDEAPTCPREAFFRNSTTLRISFGEENTLRALGIDRLKDGTVELRCPRHHPISGYRVSKK